jgi:hypothetical protein
VSIASNVIIACPRFSKQAGPSEPDAAPPHHLINPAARDVVRKIPQPAWLPASPESTLQILFRGKPSGILPKATASATESNRATCLCQARLSKIRACACCGGA